MTNPCNEHIRKALATARLLMTLANEGDVEMYDDGCGILFGVLRDCAYKIRRQAELEREAHRGRGEWQDSGTGISLSEV